MVHKSKMLPLRIESLTVFKNDVQVNYSSDTRGGKAGNFQGKQKQGELSRKSLAKLAFYAQNTEVKMNMFITLTYPKEFPKSGKEIKRHLNRFLAWIRSTGDNISYLWFLEFQKRGAPHFHIITSADLLDRKQDISQRWYDAVNSGDMKHLRAGTNIQKIRKVDGMARYVSKYAAKKEQKVLPPDFRDVGRFWGCSRDVKPEPKKTYNLKGMVGTELQEFMKGMGWEYSDSLQKPLKTLYNAAILFD